MLNKHSKRLGDYEFRTCNRHLTQDGELVKAEIVKWKSDSCYTVCYYEQHERDLDWSAKEACDRIVRCLDDEDFRELFKYGHDYLAGNIEEEELKEEDLDKLIKLKASIRDYIADFENYENREIKSVCFDLWEIVNKISRIYMDNVNVCNEKP